MTSPGFSGPFDWVSVDENNGGPTYASLSASSYHPGGVNTLLADGSVRFVKNSVSANTWRALGSVGGRRSDLVRLVLTPGGFDQ